jgi:hypothetical protein
MILQIEHRAFLDEASREGLARVVDVLLPGTANMPSGREVGVHLDLIDRVLEADPRLLPALRRIAMQASASSHVSLEDVERWAGEEVERVVFALTAAYYMAKPALRVLGYPGQARRPIAEATPDELVSEALLEPVRRRGAVYVPTPTSGVELTGNRRPVS